MFQLKLARYAPGIGSLAVILAAPGGTAFGQTPTPRTAPTDSVTLDEILVTAQKRQESVKDVPISIDVFTGENIEKLDLAGFEDLSSYLPNFYISQTPGNDAVYIRGIGTSPGTLSVEQSVSVFVDGIYGGRGRQFMEPFLDVERVEVLYGPQGGLVGKNTSAGALSITTRRPTSDPELSIVGSYEFEQETYDLTAIASGPLNEKLLGRLAAKYSDAGGFITNTGAAYGGDEYPQQENTAVRGTLVWLPGDTLSLTASGGYATFDQFGNSYETLGPTQSGGADDLDHDNASDALAGAPDHDETTSKNGVLTIDWDIGSHSLTAITGYSEYEMNKMVDGDFTATPLFGARFQESYSQWSQEVRLISSATNRFEYIVGAYFHDYDLTIQRETVFNLGPFTGQSIRVFDQQDQVLSGFAQGTFKFTDGFRANATVRYTEEEKDAQLRRTVIPPVPPTQLTTPIDDSRSESQLDPAVSLQWDVAPSTTLYASYTQGSKGGGFEGESATTTPVTFQFEDESADSYEVGAKMNFGGRATLNISVYRTDFENLQVSTLQSTPSGFQTVIQNAANARSQGVEANGAWQVTEDLQFAGSVAYNDSEYTDFPNGLCVFPNNAPNCLADISGTPIPHATKWSGNGRATYSVPVGSLALTVDGVVSYKSSTFLSESLDPRCEQPAYTKLDLRVALEGKSWHVAVLGKNLTDEWTSSHCFETPVLSAQGFRSYYDVIPRTLALEIGLRY